MTYSSQVPKNLLVKLLPIAVRKNPLGSNFRVGASNFFRRRVFRLGLPLPDDISRVVCQRLTAINADVVVLPESRPSALSLDPDLNQSIELDGVVHFEERFEKSMQSYGK